MKRLLTFKGMDGWDRAVYEDQDGNVWKDIFPRHGVTPVLCSATGNDFDGEPDSQLEDEYDFLPPGRAIWLDGIKRKRKAKKDVAQS